MRFFFYGTLMDRDVLSAVLGRRVKRSALKPARLRGYRRASARGLDYPIVFPDTSGSLAGIIMGNATAADCKKLIAYEDVDYHMVRVPVHAPGVLHAKAFLFVAKTDAFKITRNFWSLAAWQKRYKAAALAWIFRQKWRRFGS